MELISSLSGFSGTLDRYRSDGRAIGLVPTMGALHAGHASLFAAARRDCDIVAVTAFVNPLQFDSRDDLDAYPRDADGDRDTAAAEGVDVLFTPSVHAMYPSGRRSTVVHVPEISGILEGDSRPGHLDGVATVVVKLLALSGRCRAYFGEKDYQQLELVRRLVADLSLPATIVSCPIVREPDGLALSSRNVLLSPTERAAAPILYKSLVAGRAFFEAGNRKAAEIETEMSDVLGAEPLVRVDYAVAVVSSTFERAGTLDDLGSARLLVAGSFGAVRLIDNLSLDAGSGAP